MPKTLPCQWRDGQACPFADDPKEVTEYEGRNYCLFHWPHAKHDAESARRLVGHLQSLTNQGPSPNFDGAFFPRATYHFRRHTEYSLRWCIFADDCELDFGSSPTKAHISACGSTALGEMRIISIRVEKFDFSKCSFHGKILVSNKAEHAPLKDLNFSESSFDQTFILAYDNKPSRLSLDKCVFRRAPDFSQVAVLPDRTFLGASFSSSAISAEDEGRYQRIRNLLHDKRARDEEGRFYALEKRCKRLTYTYPPLRNVLARCTSWLYDAFSEYGQSYERAFTILLGLQVIAAIGYGVALNGFCWSSCGIDTNVLRFTLAQAFNPFEAYGARGIVGWMTEDLNWTPTGAWLLWTTLHSLVTIVLLALFLLALRWRFRRD